MFWGQSILNVSKHIFTNNINIASDALTLETNHLFINNEQLSLPTNLMELENENSLVSSDQKSVDNKKSEKIVALTNKHIRALKSEIKKDVQNFVNHLIFKGNVKLTSEVKFFKTELDFYNDFSKITYDINRNYSEKLQKYSDQLLSDVNPVYEVDKQFIMLDLIENANQLLLNYCAVILNTIQYDQCLGTKYKGCQAKIVYLLESLHQFIDNVKKEDMEYICEQYVICRKFPAYSDFITDIIKEILIIPDVKLNYLLKNLKLLLNEQYNFVEAVLTDALAAKLTNKLKLLIGGDMASVRNILIELREVLTTKHRIVRTKDDQAVITSRAVTMLIDLIDKAFDNSDDEILVIYIDNTSSMLRKWAAWENENQDISMSRSLANFVRYFADSIQYNWKRETREEVRALLEIILTGNATDENIYEHLFTRGPKYINSKPGIDFDESL